MSRAAVVRIEVDSGVLAFGMIAFLPVVDHGAPAIDATATTSPAPSLVIPTDAAPPVNAVSTFIKPPRIQVPAGTFPRTIELTAPPSTAKSYSRKSVRVDDPPGNTPVPEPSKAPDEV